METDRADEKLKEKTEDRRLGDRRLEDAGHLFLFSSVFCLGAQRSSVFFLLSPQQRAA